MEKNDSSFSLKLIYKLTKIREKMLQISKSYFLSKNQTYMKVKTTTSFRVKNFNSFGLLWKPIEPMIIEL